VIASGYLGVVAAFAVTVGLLLLAVYLLKKTQRGSASGQSPVALKLIKKLPLGAKQGVGLLRVADRVLVISLGEGGTRLLTELRGEELVAALTQESNAKGATFADHLKRYLPLGLVLLALTAASPGMAQTPTAPSPASALLNPETIGPPVTVTVGEGEDALRLSGAVGLVVFVGFLTLLPAMLLLMTSFTRILIVLQFLRPALGTQNSPPVQILVALSLLLTGVVMHPVLEQVNSTALQPLFRGEITQAEAYRVGVKPLRAFMLDNTGAKDLELFADLTGLESVDSDDDIPIVTLISAFVTSELRTAFQMGFLIFIPFIVVDLIVASVLMSLGMFMLPPMMMSLPFKLLLFVLADGWTLVVRNLVMSFR